jgi:hypothetical protein
MTARLHLDFRRKTSYEAATTTKYFRTALQPFNTLTHPPADSKAGKGKLALHPSFDLTSANAVGKLTVVYGCLSVVHADR